MTFDDLIRAVVRAQDDVTHLNEMGPQWEADTRSAIQRRNAAVKRLREQHDALLAACKAALQCIARLTPFPVGDPLVDAAVNKSADYADEVRAQLRAAIAKGE